MHVSSLSKVWYLNWLFLIHLSSSSCFAFFGRCMGNSFPNGFEFKFDLNPGSTVTNLTFLSYLYTKTTSSV